MSEAPVRVGVLGCAEIARRRILPALHRLDGAEITAIASRSPAKAEELAAQYDCRPVSGYAALLDRDDIDAVYVPLPASLHAQWTEAALKSGKHVLAEKPLTTRLEATRGLLSLARDLGLVLMENMMFVHHSQHEAVRRMVADGAIGELQDFQASFAIPALPPDDIRYNGALGGGALRELGIYPIRAALHLLGDRLDVVGAVLRTGAGREVETSGAALLRAEGGVTAQLTFGLDHAYRCHYQLWGSEARITLDRAFTPPADYRPTVLVEHRSGGSHEVLLAADDQVAKALSAFVTAVRSRTPPSDDCLRHAELLDEVYRAARADQSPDEQNRTLCP
ncbi:Gfo/Idh/MocA family oxidoreductase [Streptomyces pimonensis]|uniref:Gfo/Idh/MocA family oxidoreductase n=1 Tax=Streptomyces pimonensis TaxID=2860288 RepID=A0ABV4J6I9_9ACTN